MNDFCKSAMKILRSKKRSQFSVNKEIKEFDEITEGKLPKKNEIFTLISISGGFSSLSVILSIARREKIEKLYCSTFRIGKNHFTKLYKAYSVGQVGEAEFYTSDTQSKTDKGKYSYLDYIVKVCEHTGWIVKPVKNHSKVILLKTNRNHYVIETSSNLNENPKIEQFSISNDESLFNFYKDNLFELLKNV